MQLLDSNIQWTKVGFWLSCCSSTDTEQSGSISQAFTEYEPTHDVSALQKAFSHYKVPNTVCKSIVSYKGTVTLEPSEVQLEDSDFCLVFVTLLPKVILRIHMETVSSEVH